MFKKIMISTILSSLTAFGFTQTNLLANSNQNISCGKSYSDVTENKHNILISNFTQDEVIIRYKPVKANLNSIMDLWWEGKPRNQTIIPASDYKYESIYSAASSKFDSCNRHCNFYNDKSTVKFEIFILKYKDGKFSEHKIATLEPYHMKGKGICKPGIFDISPYPPELNIKVSKEKSVKSGGYKVKFFPFTQKIRSIYDQIEIDYDR